MVDTSKWSKEWGKDPLNKMHKRAYSQAWFKKSMTTPEGRYKNLIRLSKQIGRMVEITLEDYKKITTKPCFYCGENELPRGIDRQKNTRGYIKSNCVSCCKNCNRFKGILEETEFLLHCKKIVEHVFWV